MAATMLLCLRLKLLTSFFSPGLVMLITNSALQPKLPCPNSGVSCLYCSACVYLSCSCQSVCLSVSVSVMLVPCLCVCVSIMLVSVMLVSRLCMLS